MSNPDIVEAWLANQPLERLETYLRRGRQLSCAPIEELNARWIALVKTWVETIPATVDHSEREDIEAELCVRKTEPPFAAVAKITSELRRKAKEAGDEIMRNPDRAARFENELLDELARFKTATMLDDKN